MKGGILVVVGHGLLEAVLVAALFFGLQKWLNLPAVSGSIGLAGGAVLVWLGLGMIKDAGTGRVSLNAGADPGGGGQEGTAGMLAVHTLGPAASGVLTSLFNPYWSLWWATVGIGYLVLARQIGSLGVVVFFTGHVLADFTWYALVSLAVVRGSKILSQTVYLRLILYCGYFLIFLGLYFLYYGARTLV